METSERAGKKSAKRSGWREKGLTSWWFQPIWKNICQIGSSPQVGMKKMKPPTRWLFTTCSPFKNPNFLLLFKSTYDNLQSDFNPYQCVGGNCTLPQTNQNAPENGPKPQRKLIFQSSIFRCELLVSGRVHFSCKTKQSTKLICTLKKGGESRLVGFLLLLHHFCRKIICAESSSNWEWSCNPQRFAKQNIVFQKLLLQAHY